MHGALLDSELLAGVYLKMTGGQKKLTLQSDLASKPQGSLKGLTCLPVNLSDTEQQAHVEYLEYMQNKYGKCAWNEEIQPAP